MLRGRRETRAQSSRVRRQGGVHNILLMNLARDVVLPGMTNARCVALLSHFVNN